MLAGAGHGQTKNNRTMRNITHNNAPWCLHADTDGVVPAGAGRRAERVDQRVGQLFDVAARRGAALLHRLVEGLVVVGVGHEALHEVHAGRLRCQRQCGVAGAACRSRGTHIQVSGSWQKCADCDRLPGWHAERLCRKRQRGAGGTVCRSRKEEKARILEVMC